MQTEEAIQNTLKIIQKRKKDYERKYDMENQPPFDYDHLANIDRQIALYEGWENALTEVLE